MKLSTEQIKEFANYLCREEKSAATQEKYLLDVQAFCKYADGDEVTKELVVAWKKQLVEGGYAVRSKRKPRRKVPFIELAVEHGLASPDTADRTYRRALEKMRKALSK